MTTALPFDASGGLLQCRAARIGSDRPKPHKNGRDWGKASKEKIRLYSCESTVNGRAPTPVKLQKMDIMFLQALVQFILLAPGAGVHPTHAPCFAPGSARRQRSLRFWQGGLPSVPLAYRDVGSRRRPRHRWGSEGRGAGRAVVHRGCMMSARARARAGGAARERRAQGRGVGRVACNPCQGGTRAPVSDGAPGRVRGHECTATGSSGSAANRGASEQQKQYCFCWPPGGRWG